MSEIIDPPAPSGASIQRLKPNAVGLVGVLFMAVATAAPITAMVGNVPIATGTSRTAWAASWAWERDSSPPWPTWCSRRR